LRGSRPEIIRIKKNMGIWGYRSKNPKFPCTEELGYEAKKIVARAEEHRREVSP
jgi:hypothetical protein